MTNPQPDECRKDELEPLPCPFCDIPARVVHWKDWKERPRGVSVQCAYESCYTKPETGRYDDEADAIAAWNHRRSSGG